MDIKRIRQGMRTGLATAVVAAVAVTAGHGVADAAATAALCRKPSGVLAARAKCKKKEVQMPMTEFQGDPGTPGAPGAPGTQGPAGATGPQGKPGDPAGVRIVDSTGKAVGIADNYDEVVVTFSNYGPAVVGMDQAHIFDTGTFLQYESSDCSDTALMGPPTDLLAYAWVHGSDLWLPGSPKASHSIQSYEVEDSTCAADGGNATPRGLCCFSTSFTDDLVPAVHFDLSTAVGTPPFSVAK
jgi:hypothetical protein